ncbi:uncharacterized protein [Parasteatoda tepidariorum]|uniref:uncharacterized protein isoform X2 n=1 Tax=Parasteatoda tepidariorum TaxID=114398 RepID=UPI0039BCC3CE
MFCIPHEFITFEKEKIDISVTISSTTKLKVFNNMIQKSKQEDFQAKCIRCGTIMSEKRSILVRIHPPLKHPEYIANNETVGNVEETCCCCTCGTSKSFHGFIHPIDSNQNCSVSPNRNINSLKLNYGKFKEILTNNSTVNENDRNCSFAPRSSPQIQRNYNHPCSDCHVTLVLDSSKDFNEYKFLLMLQAVEKSAECFSKGSQTCNFTSADVGVGVSMSNDLPEVAVVLKDEGDESQQYISEPKLSDKELLETTPYPKYTEDGKQSTVNESELDENLHGSEGYSKQLPELNSENEAAYQSHMMNLVPCSYCSRRFNPDRIMIHENACIERPKKREYITPDNVEKK